MRAFVSYRHTGADEKEIRVLLQTAVGALSKRGVKAENILFDVRKGDFNSRLMPPANFMRLAFRMLERSNFMLVLQSSEERSEGMLMEVGFALAKRIPVIVACNKHVTNTYLPQMANHCLRWFDAADLANQLDIIDFRSLLSEQRATG